MLDETVKACWNAEHPPAPRRLLEFLYGECDANEIPYQKNFGGGTDASALQRTGSGALATTVGAPTRYMHSSMQMCHVDDVEVTIRLLAHFAETAHELLPDAKPWRTL